MLVAVAVVFFTWLLFLRKPPAKGTKSASAATQSETTSKGQSDDVQAADAMSGVGMVKIFFGTQTGKSQVSIGVVFCELSAVNMSL